MPLTIIEAMEARRVKLGLNVTAMCRTAGISPQTWYAIKARGTLAPDSFERLAFALHTTVADIARETARTQHPDEITLRQVADLIGPDGLEDPKSLRDAVELLWRSTFAGRPESTGGTR